MNTCAAIAASPPERRAPLRSLALLAVAAAMLALAGCASQPKRPPPPVVEVRPAPPPKPRPVAPAPPPVAAPEVAPLPPARNFAQDKARRKLELAADPEQAVGASEVGYYLDVLLGRLKQGLGGEAGIARNGQRIVVAMPASANFPVGGTQLTPALRTRLAALSNVLREYRRVLVSVYVRADASVLGASNPRLAQGRAQVIAAYLGGAGIDPRRVLQAPPAPGRPAAAGFARPVIELELEPILRPRGRARP